jgi:predicted enzyme related to lactoylglutathione lyase
MGSPVVHWELWSREPEKISSFYEQVFDWKVQYIPELNYRIVETGGSGGINGGIFKPQEGPLPGNLAMYIGVDNLDAYRDRILAAGGTMVVERQEVPNMGAFSLFSDPDGRVLGIWEQQPGQ